MTEVQQLVTLLREGRELAQRNLRKASQRTALWHWGDRVEEALNDLDDAATLEPTSAEVK